MGSSLGIDVEHPFTDPVLFSEDSGSVLVENVGSRRPRA
jgi:hypothetical protein